MYTKLNITRKIFQIFRYVNFPFSSFLSIIPYHIHVHLDPEGDREVGFRKRILQTLIWFVLYSLDLRRLHFEESLLTSRSITISRQTGDDGQVFPMSSLQQRTGCRLRPESPSHSFSCKLDLEQAAWRQLIHTASSVN